LATPHDNPVEFGRLRSASWLALLSLAWLQLALASHQFEHAAAFSADTCHVCVQLDRIDDTAVDSTAGQPVQVSAPVALRPSPASFITAAPDRHFGARAPPVI
jgi:hypothetical protein